MINDLMSECSLDLIGLTESWLKPDEYSLLNEALPPDFAYSHIPRALEAFDIPNKSLNAKTKDRNVVLQLSLDSVASLKPRKTKDKKLAP